MLIHLHLKVLWNGIILGNTKLRASLPVELLHLRGGRVGRRINMKVGVLLWLRRHGLAVLHYSDFPSLLDLVYLGLLPRGNDGLAQRPRSHIALVRVVVHH